ncbi:MAG: diaminopimelate epimerase [Solirubrobacterales bacterium]|nr:diaminopimelate epimerase [Solirubrobacterales bacterium]
MRFEKWQALGNDYLIVEEAELPWALTPARVRGLCHPNFGPGGDGVLLLSRTDAPHVAHLRIFNPDGSEAELSGNGAREAAMYLHARGWTADSQFSMITAAGTVHPVILDSRNCRMGIGTASLFGPDFPDGPADGSGTVLVGSERRAFQFVHVGNPQVAIHFDSVEEVDALDLPHVGPSIQADPRFPNRTNVSFWAHDADGIRARIFERGVGETMSSGTGSAGAAVAAVIGGLSSPVNVSLDGGDLIVTVDSNLGLELTGWAIPVYAATLAPETVEDLT